MDAGKFEIILKIYSGSFRKEKYDIIKKHLVVVRKIFIKG